MKDKFFSIIKRSDVSNSEVNFTVHLHSKHTIYQAHFPNNPITPGVCIIQIVKELFSFLTQTNYTIKKIKTVKFTHPINPTIHNTVNFNIKWEEKNTDLFWVKVTVSAGDVVFSKIINELQRLRKLSDLSSLTL